jgi:DNA polymerase-4
VKARIRERLGPLLRSSVGIAANVFLAKVAAERQKPDGLTVFPPGEPLSTPAALLGLDLLDLPGIGPRTLLRLERHGITSVRALCEASPEALRRAWGSVVGARWWYMLRGSRELDYGMYQIGERKSVGHSHVLPPAYRSRSGAQQILLRLFSKCMRRLREYDQLASAVEVRVVYGHERDGTGYVWRRRSGKHLHAHDDGTWLKVARPLVEALPPSRFRYVPKQASIRFSGLIRSADKNLSLFAEGEGRVEACRMVDALNARLESQVELASVYRARKAAPYRIAFGRVLEGAYCGERAGVSVLPPAISS